MNFKKSLSILEQQFYLNKQFLSTKYFLTKKFRVPKENDEFRLTLIDYIFLEYFILFVSGFTGFLLGKQHISLFLSCFLALNILILSGISLYDVALINTGAKKDLNVNYKIYNYCATDKIKYPDKTKLRCDICHQLLRTKRRRLIKDYLERRIKKVRAEKKRKSLQM